MFIFKIEASTPRCTNAYLKKPSDIEQMGKMTGRQLDRLPRELCGRPLIPILRDDIPIAQFCAHCDGPLADHERGPQVLTAYKDRRKSNPPTI